MPSVSEITEVGPSLWTTGMLPLVANPSIKRRIKDLAASCAILLCQTLLHNFPCTGSHFKSGSNDSTVSVVSCSDAAKLIKNINCYGDFARKRLLVISDGQRRTPSVQYYTSCHF